MDESDYREYGRFSFPKVSVPQIAWEVLSWLRQKTADITGFKSATAALEYYRKSGRVPLNSLSTLMSESRKGKTVGENYADKYFDVEVVSGMEGCVVLINNQPGWSKRLAGKFLDDRETTRFRSASSPRKAVKMLLETIS